MLVSYARAMPRPHSRAPAMSASTATRIDAPGRMVRAGDVITVALDRGVRVLKVTGFAERRGPGGTGTRLYEDLE